MENRLRKLSGFSTGTTHEFSLGPLFGAPFALEKRYCQNGERWSWSSFPSFSIVALMGGEAILAERMLGMLFRYLGFEVVELASYSTFGCAGSKESLFHDTRLNEVFSEFGYFYGACPVEEVEGLKKDLSLLILLRDPREILAKEYVLLKERGEEGVEGGSFDEYLSSDENWMRMERHFKFAAEQAKSSQAIIRRVEDIGRDPSAFLIDVALFATGHEPIAIINDLIERFLPKGILEGFQEKSFLSLGTEEVLADVFEKQATFLASYGYGRSSNEPLDLLDSGELRRKN